MTHPSNPDTGTDNSYYRKTLPLGQGKKAGHYIGQHDVRCYRPPLGGSATAELIDNHSLTQEPFVQSEW